MAESLTGPRSRRQAKKRTLDDGSSSSTQRFRKCENSGCPCERPECCAELSSGCSGSGYTSRWYHISIGEHFCNACFDHMYRSHKEGYAEYAKWKFSWGGCCQREASTKTYVCEKIMDYWVQCQKCHKWRTLPKSQGDLTPELSSSWVCKSISTKKKAKEKGPNPCDFSQDERVASALSAGWLSSLFEPPLLKNSPASPYLKSYFADGVGLSPTLDIDDTGSSVPSDINKGYIQPFYNPDIGEAAFTYRPDTMEQDEVKNFPLFAATREGSIIYLTLRNLILALWASNCKEYLTKERCANHIITRGLVRIPLIQEMENILQYLSIKGIVNHGIIDTVQRPVLKNESTVIVIGAGAAGLSAARHLSKFNVKIAILEARDRIGGRVWDDKTLGCCVGRGAQILNGCINNPISVLNTQLGLSMRHVSGHCDLFDGETGKPADSSLDKKVEFHFNAILDAIAEWRKNKSGKTDIPLEDRIQEMHKLFLEETQVEFSKEEEQLLEFHLGNLEYSCASQLSKVSTLHWDQNEAYPQFVGDHTLLEHGFQALLEGLAKNLDIKLNTPVTSIDYSQDKVIVYAKNGSQFTADKVIVTLPLAVLKSEMVEFTPKLPTAKTNAITNLGAGLIEKVAMKFSQNFWSKKTGGSDFFGRIPSSSSNRGSCGIFYDLSRKSSTKKNHVLMTVLTGELALQASNMSDAQIVQHVLDLLKGLFPGEAIPKPDKYIVSHWGQDPYSGMAYSFVPLGSTGQDYDEIAQSVQDKLFFAGEATNRQFPQTVTGAYLSGIREAEKILTKNFEQEEVC